ncbi:MAG: phosphatase PAP2 family protein [Leptospiraceae bacterium]|nr:phosphatase PAP2 family protein [Leptospiraceae bacterium]
MTSSGFGGSLWGAGLHPWHNLWGNIADSYTGTNSFYHLGGVAATITMVGSGADRSAQTWFQRENPIGDDIGYAMVVAGWFWQVLPAGVMYLYGYNYDSSEIMSAGSAGLQAVAVVGAITMTMKYASGRRQPLKNGEFEFYGPSGHKRSSRADDFQFFNYNIANESVRIAWPSGHTSSTFAFVSAMVAYYPDNWWLKLVGYPASAFMGLAMVDYDAHWTSDIIAGALLGHVIGYTIGSNFRRDSLATDEYSLNSRQDKIHNIGFSVFPAEGGLQASVTGFF